MTQTLEVGQSYTLAATAFYEGGEIAQDVEFSWSTNDPSVVFLSDQRTAVDGGSSVVVNANRVGSASIVATATSADGTVVDSDPEVVTVEIPMPAPSPPTPARTVVKVTLAGSPTPPAVEPPGAVSAPLQASPAVEPPAVEPWSPPPS